MDLETAATTWERVVSYLSVSNVTAHPVLVDERPSLWMEVDCNDLFEPTTGVTSD